MVPVIYENKYSGLSQALQGLIAGMDKQYRRKQAIESIVQQFQPDQQETIRKQLAGMPLEAIEQFTTVNMLNNMRNRQNQQDFISAANAIGVNLPENTTISDPVTQRLVLDAINRKQKDPMTAVIEGYNAIQNTDLPQELKQQLFNRNLGQLWLQAMGGPYRTPGFETQPKGLPFGVSPEQFAAANRAEIERKIKGSSSGGRRVIDFWDKDGNKHKKLVTDDNFNDVIQSIIESGGRLEEDSLIKELSYWQTSLQKTLDPLGYVLPGQEETAALANERISLLRDLIRGKSLPAEQPQLQGDMTEQQADTALKEIMSPEAYQQAKATGIPATELLQSVNAYLQQNKTVNNNPAQQSEKTEVNNSEKTEVNKQDENSRKEFNSMLKDGSFAEYRKLFAAGIPQKQIEEAYKSDPFVPGNNSKLAEPGYEPKTELRTWEELTDYQREKAYETYKLWWNSLGIRRRLEYIIGGETIKWGLMQKNRKEKGEFMTKEQFAKKAQNDNQFLWKFVRVPNPKGPVKINRADVDVHRALDSQRLPVFRGL